MAGLTSREGLAIQKALDLDTGYQLFYKVDQLEKLIELEVGLTRYRANEATRILEPKKTVDGKEVRPTGSLFENLIKGLDESGLISALTSVKGVQVDLDAKRSMWVATQHKLEDDHGFLPGKKYDRKTAEDMTISS